MATGWIILIGAVSLAVILFFIRQNRKDEKSFVDQLNNDYRKSKDEEGDAEIDEVKK
jgi:FtsZ-interacting cell division protein ZipA